MPYVGSMSVSSAPLSSVPVQYVLSGCCPATYPDLSTRVSRISTLNLESVESNVIDSVFSNEKVRTAIAISEKDNLIFSADKEHDMIRIIDLDCKIRGIVFGPEYSEKTNEYEYCFSVSEICDNIVASLYTERDMKKLITARIIPVWVVQSYIPSSSSCFRRRAVCPDAMPSSSFFGFRLKVTKKSFRHVCCL